MNIFRIFRLTGLCYNSKWKEIGDLADAPYFSVQGPKESECLEGTIMQMETRKCGNCGGQLAFQNNQWVCTNCGTAFVLDWENMDVERARQATAQERANAEAERIQTLTQTRQQIQMVEQRNQARREAKKTWTRILRPFIIVGGVFFLLMIGSLVQPFILSMLFRGMAEKIDDGEVSTQKNVTVTDLKILIEKDAEFQKNAIASGAYEAKYETRQQIKLSDSDEVAIRTGEPEFIESFVVDGTADYFYYMVYKNDYQVEGSDRMVEKYLCYKIFLIKMQDEDKVNCSYSTNQVYGDAFSFTDGGYASLEELYADNALTESSSKVIPVKVSDAAVADGNKKG